MKRIDDYIHPELGTLPCYEIGANDREIERRYFQNIALPRFIKEYGREPENDDELWAYNRKMCEII